MRKNNIRSHVPPRTTTTTTPIDVNTRGGVVYFVHRLVLGHSSGGVFLLMRKRGSTVCRSLRCHHYRASPTNCGAVAVTAVWPPMNPLRPACFGQLIRFRRFFGGTPFRSQRNIKSLKYARKYFRLCREKYSLEIAVSKTESMVWFKLFLVTKRPRGCVSETISSRRTTWAKLTASGRLAWCSWQSEPFNSNSNSSRFTMYEGASRRRTCLAGNLAPKCN